MNEEEKRLFDEDMEKYGITFEEWIVKMEEIAEEVEREYYIKSQQESIANFKKRHPNGAKIDTEATLDYCEPIPFAGQNQIPNYIEKELNINSSLEEIMEVVDELTEGVEVLKDFEIDDYKYEEPFIKLTKKELEELVPSIKTENSINIFTSEDNNINKRNFYMLKEFVKSIKGK